MYIINTKVDFCIKNYHFAKMRGKNAVKSTFGCGFYIFRVILKQNEPF